VFLAAKDSFEICLESNISFNLKVSDFALSISRRLQTHQLYLETAYSSLFFPYINLYEQDLHWVIVISIFIAF